MPFALLDSFCNESALQQMCFTGPDLVVKQMHTMHRRVQIVSIELAGDMIKNASEM